MKKSFSVLFAVLIIALAAFALCCSCTNSDPVRDALLARNATLACVSDVGYDAAGSSATSISVYWDASEPITMGAVSFKIQLSTDEYFFTGEGGTVIDGTVNISEFPNDAIRFTGLTAGQSYFVRVAAVYPGPSTTAWVYLSDSNGQPVAVTPGK